MNDELIPEPFRFNPMKHHLIWIRNFIEKHADRPDSTLLKQIRHIGTSVMDVYTGSLLIAGITGEMKEVLLKERHFEPSDFSGWAGSGHSDYGIVTLSDSSQWTIKYHPDQKRYIHFFPSRTSPHSFRIKANTLKSAILYIVLTGKNYINEDDLNRARAMAGLSPVKEISETEAISGMIEILRNS
ncbi:MAG TPA: hypothetical protein VK155_01375 [Bacteroidales bacterium]|jgi:hypothetical protein|nr:hypothetical protein [Bacteroidales bacterium]